MTYSQASLLSPMRNGAVSGIWTFPITSLPADNTHLLFSTVEKGAQSVRQLSDERSACSKPQVRTGSTAPDLRTLPRRHWGFESVLMCHLFWRRTSSLVEAGNGDHLFSKLVQPSLLTPRQRTSQRRRDRLKEKRSHKHSLIPRSRSKPFFFFFYVTQRLDSLNSLMS